MHLGPHPSQLPAESVLPRSERLRRAQLRELLAGRRTLIAPWRS
jgi:hypothetical protein